MMITSKDVRIELKEAQKVIDDPKTSVEEKIKRLLKILEVLTKISLSIRVSLVKTMEKLGVEKVQPRKREEVKKEEE